MRTLLARVSRSCAGSLFACSLVTAAPAGDGAYAAISFGTGVSGSSNIEVNAPLRNDNSLERKVQSAVAIGYAWDSGWRVEGEVSRALADIKGAPLIEGGGSIRATGLLLGIYRDFGDGVFRPYLGAAAGIASTRIKASNASLVNPVDLDDSASSLGFKLGAGLSLRVSSRLDIDLAYRYLHVSGFKGTVVAAPLASIPVATLPVRASFANHFVSAGVRVAF